MTWIKVALHFSECPARSDRVNGKKCGSFERCRDITPSPCTSAGYYGSRPGRVPAPRGGKPDTAGKDSDHRFRHLYSNETYLDILLGFVVRAKEPCQSPLSRAYNRSNCPWFSLLSS